MELNDEEKHPGEYVAIHKGKIIAHGEMIEVFKKLDELGIKDAHCGYVRKKDEVWVFPACS